MQVETLVGILTNRLVFLVRMQGISINLKFENQVFRVDLVCWIFGLIGHLTFWVNSSLLLRLRTTKRAQAPISKILNSKALHRRQVSSFSDALYWEDITTMYSVAES